MDGDLPAFRLQQLADPPVIVAYVPRGAGMTTLLGSLLVEGARDARIAGAVVLTDRAPPGGTYMGGIGGIVRNACPSAALSNMIEYQAARYGRALSRLALVVDDVALASRKTLKSEEFQTRLKSARDYNIMVVLATSDVDALPANVATFATHVVATRSVFVDDPKKLQRRLFTTIKSVDDLEAALASCGPFEFLVGVLRAGPQLLKYTSTLYARDAACVAPAHMWHDADAESDASADPETENGSPVCGAIGMAPELVALLSAAIDSQRA